MPSEKPFFRRLYESHYPYDLFVFLFVLVLSLGLLASMSSGFFVTDEVVYFLSARSFAINQSFEIWNGLDEVNSSLLRFTSLAAVSGGRLYGQYPPLYPIAAYPFYALFGVKGLVLMNLLSFSVSLFLLYGISLKVFKDKFVASASVVVCSLFTYFLEFAVDLWPHMLSAAVVLASVYLLLHLSRNSVNLFLVGLVSGLAVGVRYQDAVYSAVLVAYVFLSMDFRKAFSLLLGVCVPLSLVVALNYGMFGSFTTGYSELGLFFGGYRYLQLAFLSALAFVFYLLKPRLDVRLKGKASAFYLASAVLVLLVFQLHDPAWPGRLLSSLKVLYAEVFDIGAFPLLEVPSSKKSLLQASPLLFLSVFGLYRLLKSRPRDEAVVLFSAFSLAEVFFFSSVVSQHGEYTSNMRFFVESLPFLAALSAYSAAGFVRSLRAVELRVCMLSFILLFSVFLAANNGGVSLFYYRVFPLLLVLSAAAVFWRDSVKPIRKDLKALLLVAVLAYSMHISVAEVGASLSAREMQQKISQQLSSIVPGDSLLIYGSNIGILPLAPLRESKKVRFALVRENETECSLPLIEFYSRKGTPVYVVDDGRQASWTAFFSNASLNYGLTVVRLNVTDEGEFSINL